MYDECQHEDLEWVPDPIQGDYWECNDCGEEIEP